jgi:hypothetical protein
MNLFAERSISQSHAEAYGSYGLAHNPLFLISQFSMEWDKESRRDPRVNVQGMFRPVIFSLGREPVRRYTENELYPRISINAVCWQSSAVGYLHIHSYPFSCHCFIENIGDEFGNFESWTESFLLEGKLLSGILSSFSSFHRLFSNDGESYYECPDRNATRPSEVQESEIPPSFATLCGIGGILLCLYSVIRRDRQTLVSAIGYRVIGVCLMVQGYEYGQQEKERERAEIFPHDV